MRVIPNCGITDSDAKVLKEEVLSKDDPRYEEYGGYHTGLDIEAKDVHNLLHGVVAMVGQDDSGYSVVVRTGSSVCMKYSGLDSVDVHPGQEIDLGHQLGDVESSVHVEKLTQDPSMWSVRVGYDTWYKSEMGTVIEDEYVYQEINRSDLWSSVDVLEIVTDQYQEEFLQSDMTESMVDEFTGSKGDD